MGRIDKQLFRKMGELGMLGIRYDPKWGGGGLDWSFTAVMYEELVRADNAGVVDGHQRADRHGHAFAPPVRHATSSGGAIWCRRSRARWWRRSP